jgi:hypothetical protein
VVLYFRSPTHSRFTCFNLPSRFVADPRGLGCPWGRNPRISRSGRIPFPLIQQQIHFRIDFLFPRVLMVGFPQPPGFQLLKNRASSLSANIRNVDHFGLLHDRDLIPNLLPKRMPILPWEMGGASSSATPNWPFWAAGNAQRVPHANAIVLLGIF